MTSGPDTPSGRLARARARQAWRRRARAAGRADRPGRGGRGRHRARLRTARPSGSTSFCASTRDSSASPRCSSATGSAASCSTTSTRSRPATRCAARAMSCACRWDRHCSAASSIRSVARSTARGPVAADTLEPIERPAPAIIDRDLVTQPVQTGLVVVDTLFALGRGQRELIIGDRAIGKTTIAIDTIINQKTSDIVCVYVAVGQKSSSVRRAIDAIHAGGAPERCIVVVAGSASSPGLQWIAPFAGFTMAEYFRDRGQHALVVVDDLTQARRQPSRDRVVDAPIARTRGLSRRRVLCARTASGACRKAVQGKGRRLPDRAADRRDRCADLNLSRQARTVDVVGEGVDIAVRCALASS